MNMSKKDRYIPPFGLLRLTPTDAPVSRVGLQESRFKQLVNTPISNRGKRVLDLGCVGHAHVTHQACLSALPKCVAWNGDVTVVAAGEREDRSWLDPAFTQEMAFQLPIP